MFLTVLTRKPRSWSRLKAIVINAGMLSLMVANPVLAQEKIMKTLTVTGRGTEMAATSLAQIRLGVEAQGKTANEVQQEVARRSNSVVTLLKARNVERLETTGINLNPTYRYDSGTQTLTGYTASNIVSFRVATEKAGSLLDDAVKAGATRIDSVSFVASDAAIATAQKAALRKATQNAQEQADAVLSALGLVSKDIVSIQIGAAFTPPPRPVFAEIDALKKAAAAPTPVIGGDQQVEASVTLQISY
ncbi:SIMPL domain-containing protein [Leptothermofonsia sp. ETS-13]|uniref:SIMPL domain-containing protein n=1 Tax=Leptothermofonsia sp. ETS-13 TaxID=3035696 RepID=UPI003BA146F7